MTAIAGIIGWGGYTPERAVVARMRTILSKFGPDSQHEAWSGSAAMLRTLLRTTPEELFDHQPLVHSSSHTLMVFDGRIDNREALARELGIEPRRLARCADADLVLDAVLRWGDRAPEHFVGDFAMAVWDTSRQSLWLARDPLGVRPLFWHRHEQFVAFASQPSALFAIDGVVKELDPETLHDTLTLIPIRDERSFFKGIQRVIPAHVTTVSRTAGATSRRYHDFHPRQRIRFRRDDDYVAAFREQLDQAVGSRLRARGGIAAHLSSGLDSSTVTAVAAQLLMKGGHRLHAVTSAPRENFNGPVLAGWHADESPLAALVAAQYPNIRHSIYRHVSASHLDGLDDALDVLDRPPLNLDNFGWADGMSKFIARSGERVVLTGWFGNFGISYWGRERLPHLLATGRWVSLLRELRAFRRRYPGTYANWFLQSVFGPFTPRPLWHRWKRGELDDWGAVTSYAAIHPDLVRRMGTHRRAKAAGHDLSYREPWSTVAWRVAGLRLVDPGEYALLDDVKGIQARHPLGDTRLLQFLLAIPDDQFLRNAQHQFILHRAMEGALPPGLLNSRTKGQQAADWYETLEGSRDVLKRELGALGAVPAVAELVDIEALTAHAGEDVQDWGSFAAAKRYRLKLLRGLSVGRFVYRNTAGNDR
jgi:asparagine synthase (glutamine-hydrolysing)